ncbi:coiled-coil domain-containing protein 130 [Microdochium nivale]|nr:coiled-coil domain-containing protein 130 [Microdochium nivale]
MQGFNMGRYVPPDLEGTTSGNKLHSKRPPGQRVRASDGTTQQTVRFEMPFAVWCATCPKPTVIGQGVRFNAVKTRVGQYHSTPIWSFVMRHVACSGEVEIRTDPANTAYVVARGGKKRDTGEDKADDEPGEGGLRILTDREREEMRASAFKQLERTIEDREHAVQARLRIDEIEDAQAQTWEDPYAANARLRKGFRVGRHERERDGRETEDLKDRMSLGIELLPENATDALRASLVDFRPAGIGREGMGARP